MVNVRLLRPFTVEWRNSTAPCCCHEADSHGESASGGLPMRPYPEDTCELTFATRAINHACRYMWCSAT